MNRTLFIIISAVLVVLLIIAWVYMLFFRNTAPDVVDGTIDTFGVIELGDTSDPTASDSSLDTNATNENGSEDVTAEQTLQQLTTRRVAGFAEVSDEQGRGVYFIEAGVGHIYRVNPDTGEEIRLSGTTIADTVGGDISPNGMFYVVQSGEASYKKTSVGFLSTSTNSLELIDLEDQVVSYKIINNTTVLYATQNNSSVQAKSYNLQTAATENLFQIPFREAMIVWTSAVEGPHYIYPKTSVELQGAVYMSFKGGLKRLPLDGFGLSAHGDESYIITTTKQERELISTVFDTEALETIPASTVLLPEKCAFMSPTIICAHPNNVPQNNALIDDWHKGVLSFTDSLLLIYTDGSELELVNLATESGRFIDVIEPRLNQAGDTLYFKNKTNQNLWSYNVAGLATIGESGI